MPTSMTTAPFCTIAAVMACGRPIAAIRMSAWRVMSARWTVAVWATVTVALPPGDRCISRDASGLPTMLLRPQITTRFPAGS